MAAQSNKPTPSLWLLGGIVAAGAVGYLTATMNRLGWAPVGLVSLAAGLTLGLILSALAAATRTMGRWPLIALTAILALLTVAATHACLYRDFCRAWRTARAESPQLALFRPETPWSPSEYFAHELSPGRAVLWCVDAALVTAAAVATVSVRSRQTPPNPSAPSP